MQSIQFSFAWNHIKNGKILHPAIYYLMIIIITSHTIYGIRHFSYQVLYWKITKTKVAWVLMDVELELYG